MVGNLKTTKPAKKPTSGRPAEDLGPVFSCRLWRDQHEFVEKIAQETGAPYAEVVRRHFTIKRKELK